MLESLHSQLKAIQQQHEREEEERQAKAAGAGSVGVSEKLEEKEREHREGRGSETQHWTHGGYRQQVQREGQREGQRQREFAGREQRENYKWSEGAEEKERAVEEQGGGQRRERTAERQEVEGGREGERHIKRPRLNPLILGDEGTQEPQIQVQPLPEQEPAEAKKKRVYRKKAAEQPVSEKATTVTARVPVAPHRKRGRPRKVGVV